MRDPPKIVYFFMKLFLKIRRSPKKTYQLLDSAGIRKNMKILDFGCGIGSYSVEAAKLVGKAGKVIAVDQNDVMLKETGREKDRGALSNIEIVKADSIECIKESNFEPDVAGEYFFDVKEASDAGKSGTELAGIRLATITGLSR